MGDILHQVHVWTRHTERYSAPVSVESRLEEGYNSSISVEPKGEGKQNAPGQSQGVMEVQNSKLQTLYLL